MDKDIVPIDVHRKIVEFSDEGRPFAVGLVLHADGSVPQKAGVRAVIDATGKIYGTIGGGFVEAEAQRLGAEACESKRPVAFDFELDSAYARDAGAICGGFMRILVDPTATDDREAYAQAAEALRRRERGVFLTTVRDTDPPEVVVQWFAEDGVPPDVGFPGAEEVRGCLQRGAARLFVEEAKAEAPRVEVLVDPVIPKPLLLIAGGGHIGQALALQAIQLEFDVVVTDDRPEFTDPALFPDGVTTRCGEVTTEMAEFPITKDTYIVIVTRGHKYDAEALERCIRAPAAYVGMIGSKRKVGLIRDSFIESGLATEEEFDRVYAPIGMDIGAVTVEEIALSIASQLVAVRRKNRASSSPDYRMPR